MIYFRLIKPAIDRVVALVLLVILSPLVALLCVLLAIAQHGNIFFTQPRVGKNDKIFRIIKFKTMRDSRDRTGNLLPDEDRLTRVGRFVRKYSLDEIPQLLNIVKGDMSFIGPRPLLVEYLPLYNEIQRKRHSVLPGITGWAQVNGRNTLSWKERFEYDVWYVDNRTFWLEVKIFFRTILKVIVAEGISAKGMATMEKFKGN